MRLAVDGRFLLQDITGVQKVALEFVTALDRLLSQGAYPGLTVDLLVPASGAMVAEPRLDQIRLHRAGRLGGHAWEQLELPRLTGSDPLLCLGNVAPASLLLRHRVPVFTMVHDLSYKYYPAAYSRAFRLAYGMLVPLALARSERVFTVSQAERESILRCYPRLDSHRLVAVQNGGGEGAAGAAVSDRAESRERGAGAVPARKLRERQCLYVGSLTRRKNAHGLLEAAVEIVRDGRTTFTFVGSTGASFERLGLHVPPELKGRLRFLGQVNDPAVIEEEYRRAAVFVFPSFYEASPLPPIEAMRFGCPVVAADIPSLRERCGDAAVYCDPGDRSSIVGQVRTVLESADRWDELQRRGLAWAGTFTWASQVRTILAHVYGQQTHEVGTSS
jgi:glycosyltransferase involved in cell wall biosynthesis